mgnify:CR=1 FL=1
MQTAVRQLLLGVGEDPEREGLMDTPRVSRDGGSRAVEPPPPLGARGRRCHKLVLTCSRGPPPSQRSVLPRPGWT